MLNNIVTFYDVDSLGQLDLQPLPGTRKSDISTIEVNQMCHLATNQDSEMSITGDNRICCHLLEFEYKSFRLCSDDRYSRYSARYLQLKAGKCSHKEIYQERVRM
jgi:hypothetical protein